MKYIIIANDKDRQFESMDNETIVGRTIRILKELGVDNIYVYTNDDRYKNFEINCIDYECNDNWMYCLYIIDEPACYLFGNTYYSYSALEKIINSTTTDIDIITNNKDVLGFIVSNYSRFSRCVDTFRNSNTNNPFKLWDIICNDIHMENKDNNIISINDFTAKLNSSIDRIGIINKTSTELIMIHCVPARLKYVLYFIIPALEKQFVRRIIVFNDKDLSGNLTSFINSLKILPDYGCTWHLQDDILISNRFAEVINKSTGDITCGFSSVFDKFMDPVVVPRQMWWSFPCIKIPNKYNKEFIAWCNRDNIKCKKYRDCFDQNKGDDALFREFLEDNYPDCKIVNLIPNIVNHIDYMLGGSVSNPNRYRQIKKVLSKNWPEDEKYLLVELEEKLKNFPLV